MCGGFFRFLKLPHYFFDIKNGHRLVDPAGLDCSNDREAVEKARFVVRRIAAEGPAPSHRKVAVINDEGVEVGQVLVEKG